MRRKEGPNMVGCWIDIVLYIAIFVAILAFTAIFITQGRTLKALHGQKVKK
jgi:hypothetical protein